MWPNRYFANFWADRYWVPAGGATPTTRIQDLIMIGIIPFPR